MSKSKLALKGEVERQTVVTEAIRVQAKDWTRITSGRATEFRLGLGGAKRIGALPAFAILYCRSRLHKRLDTALMFVEAQRDEMLGAITHEGLARAGYPGERERAMAEFRRDWKIATGSFDPRWKVRVYTVRAIQDGDAAAVGLALVDYLYGAHLATPKATRSVTRVPNF